VYAPTAKGAHHDDLARWLSFKVETILDPELKKYLAKFEKMNPWVGSIKEAGSMSKGAMNTIKKVSDQLEFNDGRSAFLRTNPEVLLGRLWLDHKVVSFWNHWPYVTKGSERIMKFVSMFDNPKKFEYEVRNMEATYEDIAEKRPVPSSRDVET